MSEESSSSSSSTSNPAPSSAPTAVNLYPKRISDAIQAQISNRCHTLATTDPLTTENYEIWCMNVRIALRSGGVFKTFILEDLPEPTDSTHKDNWEIDRYLVAGWIAEAAGVAISHLTVKFADVGDCRGLWSWIESTYNSSTPLTRFQKYSEMFALAVPSNESWQETLQKGSKILESVAKVTPVSMTAQDVREEITVCAILQRIPSDHPFFNKATEAKSISFDKFSAQVITHESERRNTNASLAHASLAFANAANAADSSSTLPRHIIAQLMDETICYFCKNAHSFLNCRILVAAQRAYLERKESRKTSFASRSSSAHPSKLVPKKKTENANIAESTNDEDEAFFDSMEYAGQEQLLI